MQSINFEFIRDHQPVIADLGGYAEAILHIDPGAALPRLRSIAEVITRIIYRKENLPFIPNANFFDLLKAPAFLASVDKRLMDYLHFLRKNGNSAAHGGEGNQSIALQALKITHQLVSYLAIQYYRQEYASISQFIAIDHPTEPLKQAKQQAELKQQAQEIKALIKALDEQRVRAEQSESRLKSTLKEQQEAAKQSHATAQSLSWNEATSRRLLIDTMLVQAGWNLKDEYQVTLEHPVEHQPTSSGIGYADYVLWDESGKPLAVVEAKRSSEEGLQIGREQARIYADGLEKMTGQRPVIFYTNGYETYIWDDRQYNSYRPVYGFYSRDSLNYLLYQRQYRAPAIEQFNPDIEIAGRPYQIEAVKAVAKKFQDQRRKALLIQATGTGKTRVAIAISELLTRTHWGKRVLFLCDRRELRRQADSAYKIYLSTEPRCVIGEKNEIDQNARIYLSTYPGMMNRFHQLDVGFFDLIIADESHRSIYNRYREIFEYFDALQLGLTATPVKFIARNTYELFGCEDQDPTFNYSLDDAINNEQPYLVPFKVKDLTTEFLREGLYYDDLSAEQKRQLEEDLGEEAAKQTHIKGSQIGKKIFSEDTDRIILENLINNGIKDATHSLVGKTIIFAQSQQHAEHLEALFTKLYPQYGTAVCKVIHNKVTRAEALIDEFKESGNQFRIAISVDMMDTGIDVPEVVNLVFARSIKSWVKFWQMIGRGTRLCENLFGEGEDKKEFLIFDHYSNFAYFEEEYQEAEESLGKSLLEQLFEARLNLVRSSQLKNNREAFDLGVSLIRADINDLPEKSVTVKKELRTVHELQQSKLLERMEANTLHTLEKVVAPLMGSRVLREPTAISFDRLMANLQGCVVEQSSCLEDLRDVLLLGLSELPVTIQAVRQKDSVIQEVQSAAFWYNPTVIRLEWVRTELRGIMKYRERGSEPGSIETTTTKEDKSKIKEKNRSIDLGSISDTLRYRKRIKAILDKMVESNLVLQKIRNNQPIEPAEMDSLVSTILTENPGVDINILNEFYHRSSFELQTTLRELIGMDSEAVENHFTQFLHKHPELAYRQVQFMNLLKTYLSNHGTITVEKLYEAPFTSIDHEGVGGLFKSEDVDDLVEVLRPYLVTEPTQHEAH